MEIRAARPGDRRAIVRFLRGEDPEDYVLDWMSTFESGGRFFLLMDGSKIAGIVHGKLAPDGSAWMSAARVNEAYRGRGWINRMNDFAAGSVPLRHAPAAQMLITDDNTSSRRAADKGGFKIASTMSFMDWDSPKIRRKKSEPSGFRPATPAQFLRAAKGSPLIAAQGGYAYMSFNGAFALTARSARASRPWLFLSEEHGPILAARFANAKEAWVAVQPFRGGKGMADALKRFAAEQRVDAITVILPALPAARRPFRQAGYLLSPWARRVHIYRKGLARDRPIFSRAAAATRSKRL